MKIKRFNNFINESAVIDSIYDKLSEEYIELKKDILEHIDKTLSDTNDEYKFSDLKTFIEEYIVDGENSDKINGLIDENDIFNFYMKHQTDIDQFLLDDGYMDDSPIDHESRGLYENVIEGTKYTVLKMIEKLKDSLT
jgi:hypothetical protein